MKLPVAFGLPPGDLSLKSFVDTWIELMTKSGFIDQVYRRWILGKDEERLERRWSVLDNVIGIGTDDDEEGAEAVPSGETDR